MKKITFAAAIIFCLYSKAFSQNVVDSLLFIQPETVKNSLSTNFNKQLNTYLLAASLNLDKSFNNISFRINESYNSSFVRSAIKSVRDEHFLRFSTSYKLNSFFNIGIMANNNILSDSRNIEINQASQSSAAFFTQYQPEQNFYVSPFFGYINNEQTGERDYGYLYGTEGLINEVKFSDNTIYSQVKFRNEDISPRKNSIRFYNFILTNDLGHNSGNLVNAGYSQNRKDFYFTPDTITAKEFNINNNIQSRIESDYFLQDRFTTKKFLSLLDLDVAGKFLWRTIDRDTRYKSLSFNSPSIFDTKIDELRIEFETIAAYNSSFFNGILRIMYSERDENHLTKNFEGSDPILYEERSGLENRKNNKALIATAVFDGNFNLSKTDVISLSLYQNKLKYDTPSIQNFDDRDEMLSIARLRYAKFLTPFFEFFITTEATINRIVYIFSEKSSNNNINRIIRLNTGGNYRGKNFTTLNSFEVSANYTVYDFEDITPNYKSFSFRQFTARDSSSIRLNRDLTFSSYGYVKLSEQGDLKWASFSTHPTRYLREIFSESKFTVNYNPVWLSLGARVFSLNTYNYNTGERMLDSKFLSLAPLTEITILTNQSLYLRVYGWYEFIRLNDNEQRQEVNLSIQMNWNF